MSEAPPPARGLSIFTLAETRRYVRRAHARMMVAFFALLYALGSMVLGGMLILVRLPGGYTTYVLWGNALGQGPWNYPGLLIEAPWGVVSLPFLATISMLLVSVGVGLGVTVALLIAAQLVRDRRSASARPGAVGSVAGLTPAMIALVTLGACCSTTAAATAGVGLVAQASGSSLDNLLVNNWYLDLFQVVVVFVALLAQEMLLRVYGGLFGLESNGPSLDPGGREPAPLTIRTVAGSLFRAALLVSGVTWSLAMFAEWTTTSPATAGAALWFQWVFQHQLLAMVAILVALFPATFVRRFSGENSGPWDWAVRASLLVAGISLAAWVPPAVAAGGAPGFLNELMGIAGYAASWGAVPPVFSPGIALYARWGFQYLLLGGFGVALAVAPEGALRPIRWSLGAVPARPGAVPSVEPRNVASGSATAPGDPEFGSRQGMRSESVVTARSVRGP